MSRIPRIDVYDPLAAQAAGALTDSLNTGASQSLAGGNLKLEKARLRAEMAQLAVQEQLQQDQMATSERIASEGNATALKQQEMQDASFRARGQEQANLQDDAQTFAAEQAQLEAERQQEQVDALNAREERLLKEARAYNQQQEQLAFDREVALTMGQSEMAADLALQIARLKGEYADRERRTSALSIARELMSEQMRGRAANLNKMLVEKAATDAAFEKSISDQVDYGFQSAVQSAVAIDPNKALGSGGGGLGRLARDAIMGVGRLTSSRPDAVVSQYVEEKLGPLVAAEIADKIGVSLPNKQSGEALRRLLTLTLQPTPVNDDQVRLLAREKSDAIKQFTQATGNASIAGTVLRTISQQAQGMVAGDALNRAAVAVEQGRDIPNEAALARTLKKVASLGAGVKLPTLTEENGNMAKSTMLAIQAITEGVPYDEAVAMLGEAPADIFQSLQQLADASEEMTGVMNQIKAVPNAPPIDVEMAKLYTDPKTKQRVREVWDSVRAVGRTPESTR